jgi:hypothetical protein
MSMGLLELAILATVAVAFALPVALLAWMAAQYLQGRSLERRLSDLERRAAGRPADEDASATTGVAQTGEDRG